jgi:hypothetical protein
MVSGRKRCFDGCTLYVLEPLGRHQCNHYECSLSHSQLALHVHSYRHVDAVDVFTAYRDSLPACPRTTILLDDPFNRVLVRPTLCACGLQADAQYVRGATGMTTALRAGSTASHNGELRIAYALAAYESYTHNFVVC